MGAFKSIVLLFLFTTFIYAQDFNQIRLQQAQRYETQDWDKFFGTAIGYRKKLYITHPDNNLIILEIMALIKHCQTETAHMLLDSLTQFGINLTPDDKDKIEKLKQLVPALKNFSVTIKTNEKKHSLFESNKWKSDNKNYIEALRSHVENKCEK